MAVSANYTQRADLVSAVLGLQRLEDLELVQGALRVRYGELQAASTKTFRLGSKVEFFSRRGFMVKGKVTKINKKTVQVLDEEKHQIWKVSPGLLKVSA